jgi:hypothetical protein
MSGVKPHGVLVSIALGIALIAMIPSGASAQIVETREGDANPMVSVFKSTIYGGLAGLVVGLAIEVADDDDSNDALRWSFVGGTFVGLGFGIYHVMSRPGPGQALLEGGSDGWALRPPTPILAARAPGPEARGVAGIRSAELVLSEVRARLVTVSF